MSLKIFTRLMVFCMVGMAVGSLYFVNAPFQFKVLVVVGTALIYVIFPKTTESKNISLLNCGLTSLFFSIAVQADALRLSFPSTFIAFVLGSVFFVVGFHLAAYTNALFEIAADGTSSLLRAEVGIDLEDALKEYNFSSRFLFSITLNLALGGVLLFLHP